jgi:hypothetical protein
VLGGQSFRDLFTDSLKEVRGHIDGELPELVFLTGGVSRMQEIRGWVREVFPESVVITGSEPEFTIARGLASCGRIDEDLREFKEDLDKLIRSSAIEDIVEKHIPELYRSAVDVLVKPILEDVASPVFDRWRSGEIRKLEDTDAILQSEIEAYLREDKTRELLAGPVTDWLKPVVEELEEVTVPICIAHRVPYTALSLRSYLSASDIDIKVDAKNIFALEEMTFLIDSIVTAVVAILVAAIDVIPFMAGPEGVLIGIVAAVVILFLGKDKMQEAVMNMVIPRPMRKLVPRGYFMSRMERISDEVKRSFYKSLENDKNEEITGRLVDEISQQIEQCLMRMAEVVEIPLG